VLLSSLGVDGAHRKRRVSLSLLRSPPGAGRQVLHHLDTPEQVELHVGRRAVPFVQEGAALRVSILVHLNPGTTKGARRPTCKASELAALLADLGIAFDASNFHFHSADVEQEQGDLTPAYHDVPHYGPTWRWVLTRERSRAGQDERQTFVRYIWR